MRSKIIIGIVVVLFFLFLFGVPNNIRYYYEKRFDNPETFFSGVHFAVMLDNKGYYEDEYPVDDYPKIAIDLSKYQSNDVKLYMYGRYVNSADPLKITVNGKEVERIQVTRNKADLFDRYYIKKSFVVHFKDGIQLGENEIIITTGNAANRYVVYLY